MTGALMDEQEDALVLRTEDGPLRVLRSDIASVAGSGDRAVEPDGSQYFQGGPALTAGADVATAWKRGRGLFVAAAFDHFVAGLEGTGGELELRFALSKWIDFGAGLYFPGATFATGVGLLRGVTGPTTNLSGADVGLLYPAFEISVVTDFDTLTVLNPAVSVAGVRLTSGRLRADARLVTDLWLPAGGGSLGFSWGLAFEAGTAL